MSDTFREIADMAVQQSLLLASLLTDDVTRVADKPEAALVEIINLQEKVRQVETLLNNLVQAVPPKVNLRKHPAYLIAKEYLAGQP